MFDRRDVFVVVHGTWIQSSGIEPSAQGTDRPYQEPESYQQEGRAMSCSAD